MLKLLRGFIFGLSFLLATFGFLDPKGASKGASPQMQATAFVAAQVSVVALN